MVSFTSDQWIILALVFFLGILMGAFLLAGSGRKWKTRYRDEVRERELLADRHEERERHWGEREKEWRERDALRGAAIRDRDRDGVPDRRDPVVDRDRDGVDDRDEGAVTTRIDRDRDGIDDRAEPSRRAGFVDKMLGRDTDNDGIDDRRE
ncbi:hypothetical protein H8M03_01165 [Sphingomonas sabuli]|uniref:Uncharacterized protein n=1 Tax=Sphingomonas sabuli TaxID=2764186 RepID=A0A7G9L305_9SPHN|nr:hypothetical protein [Sphingomonas sabuli]QNM83004.1 hypothetical protein H8M03_01165 [Sphingomonas sabuli]